MSDKEKKILETIAKAIPNMSEFDKGYFLGKSEGAVDNKKNKNEEEGESNGNNDDFLTPKRKRNVKS